MERKNFLKGMGLLGLGSILPVNKAEAAVKTINAGKTASCVLIPTETAGPFPLDLTANTTFFRNDIRESKTGTPFKVKIKVIGDGNCLPMPNVRVNIWHCDKDGLYSGYSQTNNPGQAGQTYLRGYQMADANGEVEFTTIFPGWYSGRICHIHFQVYVSSVYAAISQMTFDVNTKNAIYAANSSEYTKGADPMSLASDNIFSDGYNYQMATLTPNSSTGGYDAYLEVTIQGSGVATGLGSLEPETGGQFKLKQNYPNPFNGETKIPFTLTNPSDVRIELFDLMGRCVTKITRPGMNAGDQEIEVNTEELGIANVSYIYQLHISNSYGHYTQCKMMTALNK